ncbi:hypothetical protein Dsin_014050 [Dipteronia sinensis]|uniref:non-specific serine/threonine protein kinase n=1 Tax=Dipteronia sinensis TaxID=43782 RepID=A0AAE0AM37_9ROSI|nr:hypothetical protein Dsin_014050 [Dipteronia sinensis]
MLMEMFGHVLFVVLLSSLSLPDLLHAQDDQSGFISLDCGSPRNSNYTERTTGINYISDAAFTDTGIGKKMMPEFQKDVQQMVWSVRSFPDGIRNCYKFNLTKGNKYLIRAYFLYGNYDQQDKVPGFDLYIGPDKWESIKLESASSAVIKEIIHVLPSSYLDFCLVNTGFGTPFISALEMRLLDSTIYKPDQSIISLNGYARLDAASTINRTVRYKDDVYDRIWLPYYGDDNWTSISTSHDVDSESSHVYKPPSIVMKSAGTPKNASKPLNVRMETDDDTSLRFYVYLHFAEIQELQANESRVCNISLNGEHWYGPFSPKYLSTTTVYSPSTLIGGNYSFSIYKTENATHPPILNALEIFTVKEFLQVQTDPKDVDAITNIKSMYGVKRNWQGDPCAPQAFMWDGLNCRDDSSNPPRIISLNLSSSGLKGEIPTFLSNLILLEYLDLSNNNLTGIVPDFLSQLPLQVLNLEGNKLTGSIPAKLLERSKNGSLSLSVGGNPNLCSSVSCKKKSNIIVPAAAAVAALLLLIAAASAIFFILKKRRQQESNYNIVDSFESKKRRFSYSEIVTMTNNFERIVGKGGFGTVYHGCLDEMDQVAVKMLSQSSVHGFEQYQAEVKLLMRVHHRNLVSLVGYCDEGYKIALIYEYMANGNLQEHLSGLYSSTSMILSWEGRLRIAVGSAQGLEYLHNGCKPPIIHRDVKSPNILLSDKFQAKLADFGLSKSFATEDNTHVSTVVAGTLGYLDPSYYVSNRLTEKSDVYSFGVVLLEIITSKSPIIRTNEYEKTSLSQWVDSLLAQGDIRNIVDPRLQGDFDINSVWKAVEIAMACLSPSANKRPTMTVVVMELNESLATEMTRINQSGSGYDSKDSIDHMISMDLGTEINPGARVSLVCVSVCLSFSVFGLLSCLVWSSRACACAPSVALAFGACIPALLLVEQMLCC